jgi:hypothetical protein
MRHRDCRRATALRTRRLLSIERQVHWPGRKATESATRRRVWFLAMTRARSRASGELVESGQPNGCSVPAHAQPQTNHGYEMEAAGAALHLCGGRVVATARSGSGQVRVALPPERHIAYRSIMAVDPETTGKCS